VTRRSSTRDNTDLLVYDIVTFADDAIRLAAGRSRADLDSDLALKLALVHLLQTIGEAARKLPERFRESLPDIPWNRIVGMRHRIVHEYWRVDANVVWEIVQQELPSLAERLRPFVKTEL
jgi:uncharacterized protein with HEPN domain